MSTRPSIKYEVDCPHPERDFREIHDAASVVYNSPKKLETIQVYQGDDLEYILQHLDDVIEKIANRGVSGASLQSVGKGATLLKGANNNFVNELRTVRDGGGIKILERDKELQLELDSVWIKTYVEKTLKKELSKTLAEYCAEYLTKGDLNPLKNRLQLLEEETDSIPITLSKSLSVLDEYKEKIDILEGYIVKQAGVIDHFNERITNIERLTINVEGNDVTIKDGGGREIDRESLKTLLDKQVSPKWETTGVTACSDNSENFTPSGDGAYCFAEMKDIRDGSATFGLSKWVREPSLDYICKMR